MKNTPKRPSWLGVLDKCIEGGALPPSGTKTARDWAYIKHIESENERLSGCMEAVCNSIAIVVGSSSVPKKIRPGLVAIAEELASALEEKA